jgi:hypothetical protein
MTSNFLSIVKERLTFFAELGPMSDSESLILKKTNKVVNKTQKKLSVVYQKNPFNINKQKI